MINFLFGLTAGILAVGIALIIGIIDAMKKLKRKSDESYKNAPYIMYMKYKKYED